MAQLSFQATLYYRVNQCRESGVLGVMSKNADGQLFSYIIVTIIQLSN